MAKKIDLGVSTGPNAAERATIRAGNKKVESVPASDSAPEPVDQHDEERLSRANKTRTIQNEIDQTHSLPGGRNNPVHSTVPGMDSTDAHHLSMAKHSADFIAAGTAGNRGKMEASRAAFHAVRSSSRGVPKGLETPCSTPGCQRTGSNGSLTCGDGSCGSGPSVQRPKG